MRHFLVITLAAVLSITAFVSCHQIGGPSLSLESDKTEIPAGGNDSATITATLKYGDSPGSGKEIVFSTTMGSFSKEDEEQQEITVSTDSSGKASVQLWSGREQGQATVTATFTDPDSSETVQKSVTVSFGQPSLTSLPISSKFELICDYKNVGGFIDPKPDIWVPCQVTAKNVRDEIIPIESLDMHFYAEAGVLEGVRDDYEGYKIYYKVRGGEAAPKNVAPLTGMEPERDCGQVNTKCNPRDGLVTLMVVTRGAESFTDLNSNGQWDEGEPFEDLPEPFLDEDDNGRYDMGEPFFDANGDGVHTNGNAVYDGDTYIWATTKILWTGKPEEAPGAAELTTSPVDISNLPDKSNITVSLRLVDKNLNPVAGFESNGDYVYFDVSGGMESVHGGQFPVTNVTGIQLDSEGRIVGVDNSAASYQETCKDSSPDSSSPEQFSIAVEAYLAPGPIGVDQNFEQYHFIFQSVISGEIQ